ncbi:MAG: carbohydrate ABC transporter permease [Verrucomicrobia bacterium]|nr:carbohydrate ABC transporter permease [Verrucomicrobiota bacterium]
MNFRRRFSFPQILLLTALLILAAATLLPFYMMLMISQKTNAEIFGHFWSLPGGLRMEYFSKALHFTYRYILNTLAVGAVVVVGTLFLSSVSGYVFARLEFGGKRVLFLLILSLMMIPGVLTLVPAFLWFKEFPFVGGNDWLGGGGSGFLNSRWVLIIPYISGSQVFGIYLCRTFFEQIPSELFEAARIDGASEFSAYWRIALPLSLPILATLAIMNFVGVYNEYIWPLVAISDKQIQVFSVGVTQFGLEGNLDLGPMMAGYVIGSIPLIIAFAFGMRYYIQGLTTGAVKA